MMSWFFNFQHTLNRLFNNYINLYWYYISSSGNMKGVSHWTPNPPLFFPEKNSLKRPSLITAFKKSLLKFTRTITNSVFGVDIYGIKLLTRLRVGLNYLREHEFRYNVQDTINPLCSCSLEIESTFHFFLRCQNFIAPRTNLMNELCKLDSSILNLDEISLTKLLLYGESKYENNVNKKILLASINTVLSTKRFEGQLMRRFS